MNSSRADDAGTPQNGLLADRYSLGAPIDRGRSTVFRAIDTRLRRQVAVKQVQLFSGYDDHDRVRSRAMREAQAAARLNNPAVVTVFDVIEEGGSIWLVMELVDAPSLSRLVDDEGPLEHARAGRIGLAVLAALDAAHAVGIVHRDVKPANVLVDEGDRIKLADFGVATIRDETRVTSTGVVLGSPAYMAPEQARGEKAGPPADLWALGATLYFAVEGQPPFYGDSPLATASAVVHGVPRPQERPGPLSPIIARLLDKDARRRPTAPELRPLLRGATRSATRAASRARSGATVRFPSVIVNEPVASPPPAQDETARFAAAPPATPPQDPRVQTNGAPVDAAAVGGPGGPVDGAEAEAEALIESDAVAQGAPGPAVAPDLDADTEARTDIDPDAAPDAEIEAAVGPNAETEADAGTGPHAETDFDAAPDADAETEAARAVDLDAETEAEAVTDAETDAGAVAPSVIEPDAGRDAEAEAAPGVDARRRDHVAAAPAHLAASAAATRGEPVAVEDLPATAPAAEVLDRRPPRRPGAAPPARAEPSSRRGLALLALAAVVVLAAVALWRTTADDGDDTATPREAGEDATTVPAGTDEPAADAGAPEATSGTTGASTTTTTTAPETAAIPDGWTAYQGATYTIAYPEGWQVRPADGPRIDFRDPATGSYLRVDWTDEPRPDPVADWEQQAAGFAARHEGYEQIRIERETYRDYNAAVWEFRYRGTTGAQLHVANLGFVAAGRGYALYFQTREERWADSQDLLAQFRQAFQPA